MITMIIEIIIINSLYAQKAKTEIKPKLKNKRIKKTTPYQKV